jgi:acetyl/propionyl-CoA carboxylase alpha subunit
VCLSLCVCVCGCVGGWGWGLRYPVLIKAIKGGGGKGMRIVERAADFDEMLASSRRESLKSFGDDNVLVEKYLVNPRYGVRAPAHRCM